MRLKPIKTEDDYTKAMARLEKIFDAKKDSKEGDELEILGMLIEKYESDNFPIDIPDSTQFTNSSSPRSALQ